MDDARPTSRYPGRPGGRSTGVGLRGRLLAAILVVALTTVAVGAVGISRMSALSDRAADVYSAGTVPVSGLKGLQSDWWQFSAYTARSQVASLPTDTIAAFRQTAATMQDALTADTAAVATMSLDPASEAAFKRFAGGVQQYQGLLAQLQQGSGTRTTAQTAALLAQMNNAESTITSSLVDAVDDAAQTARTAADDAHSTYVTARTVTLALILVGLALAVVLAVVIVRSVMRPVARLRETLDQVAEGDLSVRVDVAGGAEIGEVARSLDRTLDSLGEVLTLVSSSAGRLAGASQKLTAGADAIADNARTAASQSGVVVASAAEVASSVDTVATGSSQMEAAIREISQNASEASRVANEAVGVAEETTRTVGKLGDSSREIAAVVKLINGIAEQTNLLALNATIEAARAGESGKGFAVVANEVKELAQESAKATEDISRRVATIQSDTAGAVDAIVQISTVIGEINDFQAIIAAAVEEQTATTNEMNRNVAEAAGSSQSIASAITGLAAGAQETNARVTEAQQSAAELARMSDELQSAVRRFRV